MNSRASRIPGPVAGARHPLQEWFADARLWRRWRYGDFDSRTAPAKRRAVVTMVQDESVFLPIWVRYYSRFFAPQDMHVLDHQSTDGSTEDGRFFRVPVSHDCVDAAWMAETLQAYQHELIDRYDAVLVTDVDEIVAPDPAWGTLGDYIDRFDEPFVNCLGYELLHLRDREPSFRPDRPVLAQRGHWYANDDYDKPALATEPMEWKPGLHRRADDGFNLDPDLRLLHLHRMDYEVCLARHRHRASRGRSEAEATRGWGRHGRIIDEEPFDRWFYQESSDARLGIVVERIPDRWRGLV